MTPEHIISLLIILISVSITGTNEDFNSDTTLKRNDSFNLQHLNLQTFINDIYTLNRTAIHDTVIRLENTSVFLSNTIIIGSTILADGRMGYSVLFDNCVFDDSEIVIDSASNVTIVYSHFIMRGVEKDEEPKHVISIYNTAFFFMTDTHFGNQSKQHNQKDSMNSKINVYTNLGLKMDNVLLAEVKDGSFTGIKAEKSSGSAIFLQNTKVQMVSCELSFNIAKNGVIYGTNSVNVIIRNSSFISNYASKSGAVFYLTSSCSFINDGNVFQNNSAKKNAGVVYATQDVTINNRGCLFLHNSAEADGGVIYGKTDIEIINTESTYISNTGYKGGAICIVNKITCVNTHSTFQSNSASFRGGAIFCENDIELINYKTRFRINMVVGNGGAIFIRAGGTITNTDSSFQDNHASNAGAVIYSRIDIEVINTRTSFINNRAMGNGGVFTNFDGRKYINTGCIFFKNHAGGSGSVMSFWHGINSTNINCNFTQNTGILKGICKSRRH